MTEIINKQYYCDVCKKTQKGNANGVICGFCGKFMLQSCNCYGDLGTPRKCCEKENID